MSLEIERKFLVKEIPANLDISDKYEISQNYLAIGKEEIRIRCVIKNCISYYYFTYKNGLGFKREEFECEIYSQTYDQICDFIKTIPLTKTRYLIPHRDLLNGGLLIELDKYNQFDLIVAEVELLDENDKFIPPDWFGEEVTGKKEYSNQYLWKQIQID